MKLREDKKSYDYIGTHVDDLMVVSRKPQEWIALIEQEFALRNIESEPRYYLGTSLTRIKDGRLLLNSTKYISENLPMKTDCHPELDNSELLNKSGHKEFQHIIGLGQWIVLSGRIDIAYAISSLSRFASGPREGHLQMARHVLGYLKKYKKKGILVDPQSPKIQSIGEATVNYEEFTHQYKYYKEELDPMFPAPLIAELDLNIFCDSDHAHDLVTGRSITGLIAFFGSMPVYWKSKRQTSVHTSTFGAEFTALKDAVALAIMLRYHLRSMGIQVTKPTEIHLQGAFIISITNHNCVFNAADVTTALHESHDRGVLDLTEMPITFALEAKLTIKEVLKHANKYGLFASNTSWKEPTGTRDQPFLDCISSIKTIKRLSNNQVDSTEALHAIIQKHLAPTEDDMAVDMAVAIPTIDIASLRAITRLHKAGNSALSLDENSLSTETIELLIKAINSNATPPEEQALGHFTRRNVKPLSTWKDWEAGERKQLDQFEDLEMFGAPILYPKDRDAIILRPHWQYSVKRNGKKYAAPILHAIVMSFSSSVVHPIQRLFFAIAATLNLKVYRRADAQDTFRHKLGRSPGGATLGDSGSSAGDGARNYTGCSIRSSTGGCRTGSYTGRSTGVQKMVIYWKQRQKPNLMQLKEDHEGQNLVRLKAARGAEPGETLGAARGETL
eukprot:jgi/Psemu1/20504/gm1.20504_g